MKITYFPKAFTKKPTDGKSVYKNGGKVYNRTVTCLKDVTDVYEHGYAFRVAKDEKYTQFIILDIDDCMEGTRECIQKYTNLYCNYSASMKETKCKVFKWIDQPIEATKENLREETEKVINYLKETCSFYCSNLEVDQHQINNPKQLTYGLPRNEAFVNSELNGLPLSELDEEDSWITEKIQRLEVYRKIQPVVESFKYEKEDIDESNYTDIPLNKYELNKFLIKNRPDIFEEGKGYVNQILSLYDNFFFKNGKCCSKHFTDDHRHWAADKLTTYIAMNTVILKLFYKKDVTIKDAMYTLRKWSHFLFEKKDGIHWFETEGKYKKYQDKMVQAINIILSDCDWSEWTEEANIEDYICTHQRNFPELIVSYKPQNKEIRKARERFRNEIAPKVELYTMNNQEIRRLIDYNYSTSEPSIKEAVFDQAISLRRKDDRYKFFYSGRSDKGEKHNMTKTRSDKGTTHKSYKSHKYDFLSGMTKEQFDNYCKENNVSRRMKSYMRQYL